jgi:phosphoribosylformimino-5-aminoimidazole carboxamide ribotide isomerase
MLILPAIDIHDGRCVRLLYGSFDAVTQYGDPVEQIRDFANAGATWVHVVDLDGARMGRPAQRELIARVAGETGVKIQCGGGVRKRADVEALLECGVARVVVGSVAARKPEEAREWLTAFGPERICLAFDVRPNGESWELATNGWTASGGKTLSDALAEYPEDVVKHALVTDISRDGALGGPNVELMRKIRAQRPDVAFQASGGVSSLDDLAALKTTGVSGVIIGRALYERCFTVEEALAL